MPLRTQNREASSKHVVFEIAKQNAQMPRIHPSIVLNTPFSIHRLEKLTKMHCFVKDSKRGNRSGGFIPAKSEVVKLTGVHSSFQTLIFVAVVIIVGCRNSRSSISATERQLGAASGCSNPAPFRNQLSCSKY